jgi:carbon-monoxide dehydrogenase large subunit
VRAAFTHTPPVDAYRGAGRSECIYVLERLVDECARVAGLDPVEIRRRNFIPVDGFPFQSPVAVVYDSGDFATILDLALERADRAGFAARRAASEAAGRLRGFGLACWIESSGAGPSAIVTALGCRAGLYEASTVRVHPTGAVTVFTGAHSHGQGHETTFAQVVADKFGLDVDQIEVVHGDTALVPFGMGTYGSRSMAVGGGAVSLTADKIVEKGKKIAAHLMEASAQDVTFEDATFRVAGTDKAVAWAAVSLAAYVPANYPLTEMEPGLEETSFYDPPNFTFPNGVFVCEVEIDRETGRVVLDRLTGVHDVGRTINPMIVDGQVHGGLAQAVGQALLEGVAFDETGQIVSGSFMDYVMPRADDLPAFALQGHDVPTPTNPLGVKGAGEAGLTGGPAAIMNAVADALRAAGARPVDMPATPAKVWAALAAAG